MTLYYMLKFKCFVSPRAEVEVTKNITFGKKTKIASFVKIKATDGPLLIGENVSIGTGSFVTASKKGITIGKDTLIGPNVAMTSSTISYERLDVALTEQPSTSKGITIGDNVWIGGNTSILDGAVIGARSIIAANSVVRGKIPENSIAEGNPAKVVFTRR